MFGGVVIPTMAIELDLSEADNSATFQGSKIGGEAGLLQAEPLSLNDQKFALQVYGGDYPAPFKGIFGLSDAVGYLFIKHGINSEKIDGESGIFFVQVT